MGIIRRLFGGASDGEGQQAAPASFLPPPPPPTPPAAQQRSAGADHADGGSWYVPTDEGDHTRFINEDGSLALHLCEYKDSWGGVGLRLCEDSTGLMVSPTDRRLAKLNVLVVNVRGENHNQEGATLGDYMPGSPVALVPEPDNPYDDRAVMVCDGSGGNKCGYMNKQQARRYLKLLENGEEMEARVLFHRMEDRQRVAVQLVAAPRQTIRSIFSPPPAGAAKPRHLNG